MWEIHRIFLFIYMVMVEYLEFGVEWSIWWSKNGTVIYKSNSNFLINSFNIFSLKLSHMINVYINLQIIIQG